MENVIVVGEPSSGTTTRIGTPRLPGRVLGAKNVISGSFGGVRSHITESRPVGNCPLTHRK